MPGMTVPRLKREHSKRLSVAVCQRLERRRCHRVAHRSWYGERFCIRRACALNDGRCIRKESKLDVPAALSRYENRRNEMTIKETVAFQLCRVTRTERDIRVFKASEVCSLAILELPDSVALSTVQTAVPATRNRRPPKSMRPLR